MIYQNKIDRKRRIKMTYQEFKERDHFSFEEIMAFVYGTLVTDPPKHFDARLPAPPFLMLDRILLIQSNNRQGKIIAEQDIRLDAWYFQCHMPGDPVQPGCLGVDAIWQLLGFFCTWRGALGSGRALGCSEIAFNGQIRPFNKVVRYEVDVRRYSQLKDSGASVVIGDGRIYVDDELIATVAQGRTGVFKDIAYRDYPLRSKNSVGGIMER
jgi:3-hydroxyacyl-[acyl-carrier protein] dehydratase / trans-2-decenoyl-[acyl-carrier protein] isomerase